MSRDEPDLLDRALAGQPSEVKARVLDIVVRLGLDPTDDLFVVMIAFGFLQVLLEDYPDTLTALFDEFRGDISIWSSQHLEILETLSRKAQTDETLALNSISLLNGLEKLTDICSALMQQLPTSPTVSAISPSASRDLKEMDNWASLLRQDMESQGGKILSLLDQQNRRLNETNRIMRRLWVVVICLGAVVILLLFGLFMKQ